MSASDFAPEASSSISFVPFYKSSDNMSPPQDHRWAFTKIGREVGPYWLSALSCCLNIQPGKST